MLRLNSVVTRLALMGMLVVVGGESAFGNLALRVEDINPNPGVFDDTDVFDDTNFADWDDAAVFQGNDILVATMIGSASNSGFGISAEISNGENGIDETECVGAGGTCDGTGNVDIPNTEPVNNAIVAANTGPGTNGTGKLSNGNIIRSSVWMRSDPNNPATGVGSPGPASMPVVEGIFKIEIWKEALSDNFDFFGPGDSDFGDRIWDQDQQGGAGSFVDINGDGFSGSDGKPVTATLNTETWTQLVVEYVVDDNPADPGNTTFPWDIGLDSFTVADVESIRAVFFAGDFTGTPGTNFAGGGSWWMDNFAIEVFTDQAAANAVDPTVSNPAPIESASDFDGDGDVDGADFLGLQRFDPGSIPAWETDYPAPLSGISAVPEPSSAMLALLGVLSLGGARRRRR